MYDAPIKSDNNININININITPSLLIIVQVGQSGRRR